MRDISIPGLLLRSSLGHRSSLNEGIVMDSGRLEHEVDELLARPLGRSTEELGALLTDCAAIALQLRTAILEKQRDGAEIESLSAWSARISELMGEIRQRLDGLAPRS